jgi:hypothetical protein
MRKIHALLVCGLALSLLPALAHGQQQKQSDSSSSKSAVGRGDASAKDENIKQGKAVNDPNVKLEAPPEKGGPKTRQGLCQIHIDNRTAFYIDIYTNGVIRGTVSPFGDSWGWVACGANILYGRANFTDGSFRSWGPVQIFDNGVYTWSLYN